MSTDYPGREAEHDLGNGFSFEWLQGSAGEVIGLIEHHPPTPENAALGRKYCGGYVAWVHDPGHPNTAVRHQLIAGGPGDEGHLTLSPSLLCRHCGAHGFIRDGRWIAA